MPPRPKPNQLRFQGQVVPVDQRQYVLTPQHQRFAEEYLCDLSPEDAAVRAGLPAELGPRLLGKSKIQAAIALLKRQRTSRTMIYADEVLRRWTLALRTDHREISEHWLVPCRFCWGSDHQYQFTSVELRAEQQAHIARFAGKEPPLFDDKGGDGYTIHKAPCRGPEWVALDYEQTAEASCPACHGAGERYVIFHDTRRFSEGARYLYQGVEVTDRGGIKMKIRDVAQIEEMVARHVGLFPKEKVPVRTFNPADMTDEELDAAIDHYGPAVIEHEGQVTDVAEQVIDAENEV